ncbi:hypothetical protein F9K50_01315 [bacterium]|nr:MAG: hypothetical protein F9K50_01315 [bacterium]
MNPPSISNIGNIISKALSGQNPPEQNEEASATQEGAESTSDKVFNPRQLDSYSLKLEGGGGWKNFDNGAGMDHSGWSARLSLGFRLSFSRRVHVNSRAFFEFQRFEKPVIAGIQSNALITAGGFESELGIAVHPRWFSIHPGMGLGVSHYSSKGDNLGLRGAQYGGFTLLNPMNDTGFRAEIGLGLCTMGGALCLNPRFQADLGLTPEVRTSFSQRGEIGLNIFGVSLGASLDILQLIANARTSRRGRRPGSDSPVNSTPQKTVSGPALTNPDPAVESQPDFNEERPAEEVSSPIIDQEIVFEELSSPVNYDEVHEMEGLVRSVEQLESNQVLFVVFAADWCQACQDLKKSFDSIAAELIQENGDRLKIVWAEGRNGSEIDWVKLGVQAFPTFALIDSQGGMRFLEMNG